MYACTRTHTHTHTHTHRVVDQLLGSEVRFLPNSVSFLPFVGDADSWPWRSIKTPGHKPEGRPSSCEAQAELLSCRGRQRTGPTRGEQEGRGIPMPGPRKTLFHWGNRGSSSRFTLGPLEVAGASWGSGLGAHTSVG